MTIQLPDAGAANNDLKLKAHAWWMDCAMEAGVNLANFICDSPLEVRLAWARNVGWEIGTLLSRFSSKMQHSTESQVYENIRFATRLKIYIPPEYISVDEAQHGRRQRRDGIERSKMILANKLVSTLVVFKVSRLMRVGYKGFAFVNEQVVERGLRAISVSQGIDTQDEKSWKALMYLHGLMDDMLLDTIADHCRAGLSTLFLDGFVTGALPVGFAPKPVPGASLTKRGLPRSKPVVVQDTAKLIVQHYEWIRYGMPISEGHLRWVKAGGPCDPRASTKQMSYPAYRRMLSNPRYLGVWAFGRFRNRWSTSKDYSVKIEQPESEVRFYRCEELRIVPDELFAEVQQQLLRHKKRSRGPRQERPVQLWDLTTGLFYCAACSTPDDPIRFYQTGAHGNGMGCKKGRFCTCYSAVRRKDAVLALCQAACRQIKEQSPLIEAVVTRAVELDQQPEAGREARIHDLKRKIRVVTSRINDLYELLGGGSDEDRTEMKSRIRDQLSARTLLQEELKRLEEDNGTAARKLTPEGARQVMFEFHDTLAAAAAGELGPDAVYRAYSLFERLIGRVLVHVEQRPGRKQTVVRGVFCCNLAAVVASLHDGCDINLPPPREVSVWLREPPRIDRIAERAHELIDLQRMSHRAAADQLCKEEDQKVNSGNVWYAYRRWYAMRGLPVPASTYNNGKPRQPK